MLKMGNVRIPLPMFLECPWEASNTQKMKRTLLALSSGTRTNLHKDTSDAPQVGAARALPCDSRIRSRFDDTAAGATHNDVVRSQKFHGWGSVATSRTCPGDTCPESAPFVENGINVSHPGIVGNRKIWAVMERGAIGFC